MERIMDRERHPSQTVRITAPQLSDAASDEPSHKAAAEHWGEPELRWPTGNKGEQVYRFGMPGIGTLEVTQSAAGFKDQVMSAALVSREHRVLGTGRQH